jgi:hypothetical protein
LGYSPQQSSRHSSSWKLGRTCPKWTTSKPTNN